MKIARKSETKINQVGKTCVAMEYQLLDKRIHGAVIEVSQRYPDAGNDFYSLALSKRGLKKRIRANDASLTYCEETHWEGKAKIFMPCAPAWYPEQHKFSK